MKSQIPDSSLFAFNLELGPKSILGIISSVCPVIAMITSFVNNMILFKISFYIQLSGADATTLGSRDLERSRDWYV